MGTRENNGLKKDRPLQTKIKWISTTGNPRENRFARSEKRRKLFNDRDGDTKEKIRWTRSATRAWPSFTEQRVCDRGYVRVHATLSANRSFPHEQVAPVAPREQDEHPRDRYRACSLV
jgi:hypothetical protein